jgi:hypothetical protein
VIVTKMSKNKQKETCLACNKGFTKTDASIQCAICALWIHHKPCSTISDDGFKFLSEQVQATGSADWACRSCMAYSKAITQKVRDVEKRLDEVQKEVREGAKEIDRVDKSVDKLRDELDKVKEANKNEKANYITADEYREREARRLNVVLHRVNESDERTGDDRKAADLTVCNSIFNTIGLGDWTHDIKACRRIGERRDEPRPLLVILRCETTRTALLEAARHLRNTPYAEVSIVPDLTPAQRQEEAALNLEMERRNKDELTDDDVQKNLKWHVVGPRGARRLIKSYARNQSGPTATRGRGGGQRYMRGPRPASSSTRGRVPTVPQPLGRGQPIIQPVTLLPPPPDSRKRTRDQTAAPRDREHEEAEVMEEEEDKSTDETRSPACKR